MLKGLNMGNGNSLAPFVVGIVFGILFAWLCSLSPISTANEEMATIFHICEQLEHKYKDDALLKMYLPEIRKGFAAYYHSKSGKDMDNGIIVRWWDKLVEMDEISDRFPSSD